MKGKIYINVKHKDGREENRVEHNQVFDLPALCYKDFFESGVGPLIGKPNTPYLAASVFNYFDLSEEAVDLEKRIWVPPTLRTQSSASSNWYSVPLSNSSIEDQKISRTATWAIGEDLELNSIYFPFNDQGGYLSNNGNSSSYYSLIIDNVYMLSRGSNSYKTYNYRVNTSPNNFAFGRNSYGGYWDGDTTSQLGSYIPYPLADATERFLWVSSALTSNSYLAYPTTDCNVLKIYDKATDEVKRTFPLTQFESAPASSSYYPYLYVINTGTKNYLMYLTTTLGYVWQIPDQSTEDTIPLLQTDFLATQRAQMTYSALQSIIIEKNYLIASSESSTMKVWGKINDDLSVSEFHGGALSFGSYDSSDTWSHRNIGGEPYFYYGGNSLGVSFYYYCNFITASNFSQPLSLVAGDVLTVTYEVTLE